MIVVKVELHSAITGKVTEIGRAIISNDGTSRDSARGSYDVKIGRRGVTANGLIWRKPQKVGRVENYPRKSYSIWELVRRAVTAALGKKPEPELNQCDGCAAGKPLLTGNIHRMGEGAYPDYMGCTAELYT